MRERFEELRVIAVLLSFRSAIHWNEKRGRYESHDNKDEYDCMYLNGAWYAFQEQQKRIDSVIEVLSKVDYGSGHCAIDLKEWIVCMLKK